jgi:hypothetical protein
MPSQAAVPSITGRPQPKPKLAANIVVARKVYHEFARYSTGAKALAMYLADMMSWDSERGEFNAFPGHELIGKALADHRGLPASPSSVKRWLRELTTPGPGQVFMVTARARGRGYAPNVTRGHPHRSNRYSLVINATALHAARADRLQDAAVSSMGRMPASADYGTFGSDSRAQEFKRRELALQAQHLRGDLSRADLDAAVERLRHEFQGVLTFPQ